MKEEESIENTYRWEIAEGEDAQETGLSTCAIAYDDQFPM